MDRFLHAFAADALEPGDALAVQRARVRPGVAARLDHAQALLGRDSLDPTSPDQPAPRGPWLVGDTGRIMLGALHLDAGAWRAGDRLPVVLDGDLPPDARLVVVLTTRAGRRILSPVDGQHLRIAQLRRMESGWALDLVLDATPGLHHLRVEVLAPDSDQVLASAELAVRIET